jgi:hypothetical protein
LKALNTDVRMRDLIVPGRFVTYEARGETKCALHDEQAHEFPYGLKSVNYTMCNVAKTKAWFTTLWDP